MPAGETVLRWFWYGAMTTDGERVHGPERFLFVNCKEPLVSLKEPLVSLGGHIFAIKQKIRFEILFGGFRGILRVLWGWACFLC